jgi:WD40 repeat protein
VKIYTSTFSLSTNIASNANLKNFDIRQTTSTPIKFIASGNDTKSYYALDNNPGSMTLNSYTLSTFLSNGVMTPACYSGDAAFYAFGGGGSDPRVFIFADNNTLYSVFNDSTISLLSCSFTPDGSYLYFGSILSSSIANIYIYKKNCF